MVTLYLADFLISSWLGSSPRGCWVNCRGRSDPVCAHHGPKWHDILVQNVIILSQCYPHPITLTRMNNLNHCDICNLAKIHTQFLLQYSYGMIITPAGTMWMDHCCRHFLYFCACFHKNKNIDSILFSCKHFLHIHAAVMQASKKTQTEKAKNILLISAVICTDWYSYR